MPFVRAFRLPWKFGGGLAASLLVAACHTPPAAGPPPRQPPRAPAGEAPTPVGEPSAPVAPGPAAEPPANPRERVLLMTVDPSTKEARESWIERADAQSQGYTVVDLGESWTPYIFREHVTPEGQPLPNRYRRVFIGLANDTLDEDGEPLRPGAQNYLELYGIFPSLSVLRRRFVEDADKTCDDQPPVGLTAVDTVEALPPHRRAAEDAKARRLRHELEPLRRRARAATLDELAIKRPDLAPKVKLVQRIEGAKQAMAEAERRLACEGFLAPTDHHQAGAFDDALRKAIRRFQQKHMVYEGHSLRRRTVDALARPLLDNDHASLLRALRERVVDAAEILEDGTTETRNGPQAFVAANGSKTPLINLADEYTKQAAQQLGWETVEGALAFFRRHEPADFANLLVAVKLPPRPEYYSPDMDLQIVIDRGDVWYDLPWDASGNRLPQPRKKYPSFTLIMRYRGQRFPLVRWRTTIGGWRAEQAPDGYEYFRYKGSDVGPRVVRNVLAGPVWIAPESTPIRSLIKTKALGKSWQRVVNYDELGPGYLSAYGLVAGYFVVPGVNGRPDFDNGIRAHGSSDYLSIYSDAGYSHGCHRLPNHLAIRLYSFILRHRTVHVVGDLPLDMARQFLRDSDVFEMRIPSRGYGYTLDPPLPVDVLEGDIKGQLKQPVLAYVPKPGVRYPGPPPPPPNSPEARAGGAAAAGKAKSGRRPAGAEAPDDEEEATP